MNKSLIYTLIAAVLGVLVVVPLFFVSAIENVERYKEFPTLQAFPERMKMLEETYGTVVQSYSFGIMTFAISFAVAIIAYLIVKGKFSV